MQCKQIKTDNIQCNAKAMQNSDYCYLHNPEIPEEEKRQAQARGGENRPHRIDKPLSIIEINEPKDVVVLLADTINSVRQGEMDVKLANCLGVLSGQMIRAIALLIQNTPEPLRKISLEDKSKEIQRIFGVDLINGCVVATHPNAHPHNLVTNLVKDG
ncbi:MAG: hypothetical protein WC890_04895 [Candidatus Margulisiibacteriota bacterium]